MNTVLSFKGQKVRHVLILADPWFVAVDVCRCLGLALDGGVSRHLHRLDVDERKLLKKGDFHKDRQSECRTYLPLFERFDSSLTLISESGLYKLIMRADKAEARPFQDWVTREVLPSIRKTGSYSMEPAQAPPALAGPSRRPRYGLKCDRSSSGYATLSKASRSCATV